MINKVEPSDVPSRYQAKPDWSYDHLFFMYKSLLYEYAAMIKMCSAAQAHSLSVERLNTQLEDNLANALEGFNRCYKAHRKVDNEFPEMQFKEMNRVRQDIPSSKIVDSEL
jgi:hypothetical protein